MENETQDQGQAQAQAPAENLSVRQQLEAAYEQAQEPAAPQETEGAEPAEADVPEPQQTSKEPVKTAPQKPAEAPKEVKDKAAATPSDEAPPPAEFLGASKIDWKRLPVTVKKEILSRYDEFQKKSQEVEAVRQRYAEVDTALAPHLHRLATNYGSVGRALDQLARYERAFSQSPAETIAHLAQQSGIDLAQLAALVQGSQQPQVPQQQQATNDPYAQRIAAVESHLLAQERERRQAINAEAQRLVQSVQTDERFPFFNDVRATMGQLIDNGLAHSLQDAYDQAVWSNPDLRQHLIAAQREQVTQAKTNEAARARRASSSLRGGTAAPGTDLSIPNNLSVRDALAQAADQLGL